MITSSKINGNTVTTQAKGLSRKQGWQQSH